MTILENVVPADGRTEEPRKRMKSDTDEQMYPGINFGVLSGRQYCGRNVGMKASVKATTLKVTLMQ